MLMSLLVHLTLLGHHYLLVFLLTPAVRVRHVLRAVVRPDIDQLEFIRVLPRLVSVVGATRLGNDVCIAGRCQTPAVRSV